MQAFDDFADNSARHEQNQRKKTPNIELNIFFSRIFSTEITTTGLNIFHSKIFAENNNLGDFDPEDSRMKFNLDLGIADFNLT